jgi:tetratricopeptide (TPR) repeat protein
MANSLRKQTPVVTPVASAALTTSTMTSDERALQEARPDTRHFFRMEDWWAAAATFLFSTIVFYYHMAPEVTLQDSGELVTGAFTFGVPHPPGYPLWALLGYIWSHVVVPFGNPAWRIGTMSVFTGGLTVGVLTLMMTRSTRVLLHTLPWSKDIEERLLHWIALMVGMSTALLFGFNRGVWLWASVSEMRVLNAFSFILIACTFFAWMTQPKRMGFLYVTLLIFGLSMTNHQTVGVMALALVAGTLAEGLDQFFHARSTLSAKDAPRTMPLLMSSLATFWELSVAVLFSLSAVFLLFGWLRTDDLGQLFHGPALGPDIWRTVIILIVATAGILGMRKGGGMESWVRKVLALIVCTVAIAIYCDKSGDPLVQQADLRKTWTLLGLGALFLGVGSEYGWIKPRQALRYTGLFLAGCAFYLYMPIASLTNPPMNWGYAGTKAGFLHAITRGQYEKLQGADPFGAMFGTQIWIFIRGLFHQYSIALCVLGLITLLVATIWIVTKLIEQRDKYQWIVWLWLGFMPLATIGMVLMRKVVLGLPVEFGLPAIIWGVSLSTILSMLIGAWLYLRWPGRSWLIFVWAAFLASSLGLIMIINPKLDKQEQEITIKFFAPAHGFYAMLIGYGIAMVFGFMLWLWKDVPRLLVQVAAVALLALPYVTYRENWSLCSLRTHDFGYQFGYRMFCPGGGYPDMETNAVLYGGTDPGRFVPTYMIFCESRVKPQDRYQSANLLPKDGFKEGSSFDRSDVYIITQNALADNTYMSYIRDHYDISRPTNNATMLQRALGRDHTFPVDPIRIPTPDDSTKAFQQFVEDWKAGKAPPGADLKIEGGRVQVTGVQAVMAINGILARWIFDWNKEKHAFYVEESYVIPWMYPYLRPAGVIMKIDKDPLPPPQRDATGTLVGVWSEIVTKDKAYWDALTGDFTNREEFVRNKDAQKSFSKMRSAIAGLYLSRGMLAEAEYAFRQSLQLCPDSPEGCFRLADLLMNQRRYDDARQLMEGYLKVDEYNGNVKGFLNQIDNLAAMDNRRNELQAKLAKGADYKEVMELMVIFSRMNMPQEMGQLGANMLNNSNTPPVYLMQLAQLCSDTRNPDMAAEAWRRYLARVPQDSRGWIELGWIQLSKNQGQEGLASWQKAVEIGGEAARGVLRSDKRFQPLWQQRDLPPQFHRLIQATKPPRMLDLEL